MGEQYATIDHAARPSRDAAIELARTWIFEARRIDMGALASELGIGRATVHRWFGTRERLIGDVLWLLADRAISELELEADGRGAGRVAFVVAGMAERFLASKAIRAFAAAEPAAVSILGSPESQLLARFNDRVRQLIDVERRLGAIAPDVDADETVKVIVRASSAIVFADLVTDSPADVTAIARVVTALLTAHAGQAAR
jgi:AcrR family transcriptional regulator